MKNTMMVELAEIFCPQHCIACGKSGGILCEDCKKNLQMSGKIRREKDGIYYLAKREGLVKQLINLYKYQAQRAIS